MYSAKGRLKSLELQLQDVSIWIDIPKYLGYSLQDRLEQGVELQAWVRPQNVKQFYFKALMIVPAEPVASSPLIRFSPIQTIRVCTKGSCRKKGSLQLLAQLENQTQAQGLTDRIRVQAIGCLKQCKTAPNMQLPHGQTLGAVSAIDLESILSRCQSVG